MTTSTFVPAAATGVSDHGELAGLGDDDHALYLTTAEGNTAYDVAGAAAAAQAAAVQRANHTGTQAESTVVNLVADLAAKALGADLTAEAATARAAEAAAVQRANHTGTQLASTISDFASAVATQQEVRSWKQPVRVAATANVSVSSAPTTIDSVTLVSGDRVLLPNQTAGAENGIYVFSAASSPLVRSADADSAADLLAGLTVLATEGTTQALSVWRLTTTGAITVGTTSLAFSPRLLVPGFGMLGVAVGTPGLAFANDPDTGIYSVGANILDIAAGGVRRFSVSSGGIAMANNAIPLTDAALDLGTSALRWRDGYFSRGLILGSGLYKVGGVLNVNTATVGNVGAGEDDLTSYTVPAGLLAANGDSVSFAASGSIAASVNAKRIRVRFGSTLIFDTGAAGIPISTAIDWVLEGQVIRTGAATQKCRVTLNTSNASLAAYADYSTAAETLSGALALKITAEAVSDNDLVQELMSVRFEPAP